MHLACSISRKESLTACSYRRGPRRLDLCEIGLNSALQCAVSQSFGSRYGDKTFEGVYNGFTLNIQNSLWDAGYSSMKNVGMLYHRQETSIKRVLKFNERLNECANLWKSCFNAQWCTKCALMNENVQWLKAVSAVMNYEEIKGDLVTGSLYEIRWCGESVLKTSEIPLFVDDDKKGHQNFWGMKWKFFTWFWV